MLGLLQPTDPCWVDAVEGDLDGLLSDHAHCELKAAHSALSLVGRFGGEAPELVGPLVELAREEAGHFESVQRRIAARGGRLQPRASDGYVRALRRAAGDERGAAPDLLDHLLVAALIEARSCERFKLLAERLPQDELAGFYRELMASEARHFTLFSGLAETRFGAAESRRRLRLLAGREAEIAEGLPLGPTVHG
jgi:tRNA-(ms[2]io[6]A)-hydroxylase